MGRYPSQLYEKNIEGKTSIMISKSELIHHKIQAAMRENEWIDEDLKYLGHRGGHHWYLINGEHKVTAEQIEDFERIDETESDPL